MQQTPLRVVEVLRVAAAPPDGTPPALTIDSPTSGLQVTLNAGVVTIAVRGRVTDAESEISSCTITLDSVQSDRARDEKRCEGCRIHRRAVHLLGEDWTAPDTAAASSSQSTSSASGPDASSATRQPMGMNADTSSAAPQLPGCAGSGWSRGAPRPIAWATAAARARHRVGY